MGEVKGQTIFLSVVAVATLLVAIVGTTFAWFNISLSGDDETKNIVIKTASLSSITFEDGAEIDVSNLIPGNESKKTFTIAQTDPTATETVAYEIKLNILSNTLTENANGAFVNSLTGEGNKNGGKLVELNETEVPSTSEVLGSGELVGYETHTYTYTLALKSLDEDQSGCLNKEFSGYISANLVGISK